MASGLSFRDWTSELVLGKGAKLHPGCVKKLSAFNSDGWLASELNHCTDWVIEEEQLKSMLTMMP